MENQVKVPARRLVSTAVAMSAAVLLLASMAEAQDPPLLPSSQTAEVAQIATTTAEPAAAAQELPQPTPSSVLSNMRIRGYADVGFGKPLQEKLPEGGLQDSKNSFQIGDFHLFVTTKLSDQWSFLSEMVVTSGFSNEFSAELDRLVAQYSPNKHVRVGLGKFNSGLSYYTNQFQLAKFYQTTTGRPIMFTDNEDGGILPIHQVGITVRGEIPSGRLGLHYIGELGNGRAFTSNGDADQNFVDVNNAKAVTGGLFIRPDAVPALDVGFAMYRDTVESDTLETFRETITTVHAVWLTPNLEFLNEAAILKHRSEDGDSATTKSFYSQVSRRFGVTRPYGRYDYQDVPLNDPILGQGEVAVAFGPRKAVSGGVRVDIRQFAVVKVQFDRALLHDVWASGVHAQLAFAF